MSSIGETQFVPVPGGKLAVTVAGAGEPLIFLHKLGGNASEWEAVAKPLADRRKLVLIDLPGHGASQMDCEPPLLVTHAMLAAMVEQALAWLDIRSQVDFVASSIGASVALVFAAMFPWRVGKVISTGASWTQGNTVEAIEEAAKAAIDVEFDADGNPLARSLEFYRLFGFERQEQADQLNRTRAEAGRWIGPLARAVAFDPFAPYLKEIRAEIVLAYGEKGHYGDYAREAESRFANARSVEIPGSTSFPQEDKPEALLQVILAALGGSPSGSDDYRAQTVPVDPS